MTEDGRHEPQGPERDRSRTQEGPHVLLILSFSSYIGFAMRHRPKKAKYDRVGYDRAFEPKSL